MSNRMDLAMGEATQYRRYCNLGNMVMARQTRTTIEELVGRRGQSGKWVLPQSVADAMGRPDLAGA